MILRNLTTNEKANYHRYRHFKTPEGKFRNPFDRGVMMNCLEYWHIIDPVHIARTRPQSHVV